MKAHIDINRRSNEDGHQIEFVIKLGVGHAITATMSAEDFILALTGRSEVPAEIRGRNLSITETRKQVKS